MPKYPREKGKPVDLPVYGDAKHNMAIYHAIGVLLINWGSDESVFLAMIQALLGGDNQTAVIVWFSFYNTANRLDLVRRLTKQHVTDKALRADIESAVVEFGGCTKTRNFFCHAAYGGDDQARLRVAHSISLSDEGDPLIRDASRLLDRSTLHDVVETARRLADLNPVLWHLVRRLEDALQVPPAKWQTSIQLESKFQVAAFPCVTDNVTANLKLRIILMTPSDRRERARLRSERWRRAHGIMPRRPAQRSWLAEGISRSTCPRAFIEI